MPLSPESKIAYLPAGEMNTALAIKGRANGYRGTLWNYSERSQQHFEKHNESWRLQGIPLEGIEATHDMQEALNGAQVVFFAPRSENFETVIAGAKQYITEDTLLVTAIKGFVEVDGNFYTPSQVIEQEVPHARDRVAVLAGPNFARQVAEGKLSGTAVIAHDLQTAGQVKEIVHKDEVFRVDIYKGDPVPMEIVTAFKNVVGLIMGFAKTLPEYGENTGALILQKGLAEASLLCEALGGDSKAIMELYGVGDYGLLMNSTTSRNVRAGMAFGMRKIDLEGLLRSDLTIEGVRTVKAIRKIARDHEVYLPLAMTVYRVLYTGRDSDYAVRRLLRRNS